ncbi:MAG: hypothetical protein ACOH1J_06375 [Microbacteriaceae bacterium]
MALSRKRQRELKRLKNQAEDLLHDQKEVLEHASRVVRDASRQAAHYAREDVGPRFRDAYEDRVKPALNTGVSATKHAAATTREKFVDDIFPAVTGALGSALAALEVSRSPQVRDAIAAVRKNATAVGVRTGLVAAPKSSGPGKYILIGIGVVAAAGIAYAAWQTLRADDDLWIDDEPETADSV